MYNLFLDDERHPHQVTWVDIPKNVIWNVVRSYDEFVAHITEFGKPKYVTFDHDLADTHYAVMLEENKYEYDDGDMKKTFDYGSEKTGFDCAKWLVEYCHENDVHFPIFEVHSMNPIGAKRINDYIMDAYANGYIFF
jgi:hypothetical protein